MGCRKLNPKVGDKIGAWEVIGEPFRDPALRGYRIPCRCACGAETAVILLNLMRGNTLGCRSCYHLRPRPHATVPAWFWAHIVCNAKKRGIALEISLENAEQLYKAQGGLCALSGRPIDFSNNSIKRSDSTASLDRKDSNLGYVEGNTQWVHKTINLMKNVLDEKEFVSWCTHVVNARKPASDT